MHVIVHVQPPLSARPVQVLQIEEFPFSDKLEDVMRLVHTHYKLQITQLYSGFARYLVHDVTHYLHCFVHLVVHNTDASNVGPPHSFSLT